MLEPLSIPYSPTGDHCFSKTFFVLPISANFANVMGLAIS